MNVNRIGMTDNNGFANLIRYNPTCESPGCGSLQIDHIIAKKHDAETSELNLANLIADSSFQRLIRFETKAGFGNNKIDIVYGTQKNKSLSERAGCVVSSEEAPESLKILIDADACPKSIKEILFKTAKRLQVRLIVVANQTMRVPESELFQVYTVTDGADVADDRIVDLMNPGDIVITGDIPLASRVVEKQGVAIGTRGELFDESSVHGRLATRNLMEQFRSAGAETGGPRPMSPKDVQTFANILDKTLTRSLRDQERRRSRKN